MLKPLFLCALLLSCCPAMAKDAHKSSNKVVITATITFVDVVKVKPNAPPVIQNGSAQVTTVGDTTTVIVR